MNKFKEFFYALMAKGFATAEDRAKLKELADEAKEQSDEDTSKEVDEQVEEAEELPEEDPEADEEVSEDEEVEKNLKNMLNKAMYDVKKEAKKEMEQSIKKALREHESLKEKKAGLYSPEVQEKRAGMNSRFRKFVNALMVQDHGTLKEMQAENPLYKKELTTDSSGSPFGGYVVDDELNAEIMHLMTEYGVARREMTVHQLTKGSYTVNDLATDLTVAWADTETTSLLSTQFVLGQGTLTLKRLYAIVTLTNTLLEDSEIDLTGFIAERVAEGFAGAEDDAFFNGDGTSTYGSFTGILANSGLNEVTMAGGTFASLDADDLIDMVDATPQGALRNGKFYMHRSIMSLVRKLKDTDGQYIYQRPSESGPATIWGYPVVLVEKMPDTDDSATSTSFVLFGDLKKHAVFGFKGGIRAEQFSAGIVRNVADSGDINLITSDRQAVRFIERVGYLAVIDNAMTKLTTNASA